MNFLEWSKRCRILEKRCIWLASWGLGDFLWAKVDQEVLEYVICVVQMVGWTMECSF